MISNDAKKDVAEDTYNKFLDRDVDVIIDDVKGSIGEKIRNAKILGIPYIAIMGNNTEEGFVEVERTKDGAKTTMSIEELIETFENMKKDKKDIDF